ncbi:MAG TPA: HEAT repeat domain-containing protein [Thermoguttaceae bacterium]|nr:HEAT repeat domain-containing protein [Thermoguttaceae bacterium]
MLRFVEHVRAAALIVLTLACVSPARGESFELRDGGRVVGRLLNPDESPRKTYRIETLSGGRITLAADQVARREVLSPKESEYEKRRAESPDTIEGHWKLAEWCRENFLSAQRKVHLDRILQMDPDHPAARAALGYTKVEGEWKTRRETMKDRGYQWFRGRWRTAQEIEILKRQDETAKGRQKWFGLVKRYDTWLDGDRFEQGRQAILAIDDPAAVGALDHFLANGERREVKAIYLEALGRLNTPDAVKALAICAVEDNDQETRLLCLDHLRKEKRPDVVAYFIRMLKHKDNEIINRAAVGLSYMGDKSAVPPLIDALVTRHTYKINSGNPGNIGASFGSGGTGLGVGPRVQRVRVTKENQAVLDAIVSLVGGNVNFGFDVEAWKYWYAQHNKRPTVDARRD